VYADQIAATLFTFRGLFLMTPVIQEFDIAIIGGGNVGTSLACILSASQPASRIALIEINSLPTNIAQHYSSGFDARSTALAYGSAHIFQQLGVWAQLREHVTAIQKVHVSDRGHFAGSVIDAAEQGVEAVGYVIENAWLGGVLSVHAQQQKNITCFAPARVEAVIPQAQGALLKVRGANNEEYQLLCQLAVIADGGESPMRRALGIHTRTADYHQTAIITNVAFNRPHKGIAYERFTEDGPLALLPLGESSDSRRAALVWTLPKRDAQEYIQASDAEFLAALQTRFGYRLGQFEKVGKRHAYSLQLVTAEEQVRSHVVLVGNAAHFLHPVAGQGFNLALRDCVCLAEVLLEAAQQNKKPGDLLTLQQYLARQREDQAITIQFSDRLVRLFSSAQLPLIAFRHLGFMSLAAMPPVKRLLAERAMGASGRRSRWQTFTPDQLQLP
jgi:2-polyprenyl-6-methoxyphenol 4-hydroxylase